MSLILATLAGPAFCPLPGIGRVHCISREFEQPGPPLPVGNPVEIGNERREAIVAAIRRGQNTRALISKDTGIPMGSLTPHMRKLVESGAIVIIQASVRGHAETIYGAAHA